MLSFATPWWLLLLLSLPLVWWVHRYHAHGQVFPVAALFLWSGDQQLGSSGNLAARAHPLWWLRGLLVGLLVLALAGPEWDTGRARPLTIWVDDSLSMYSRDAQGKTRIQRVLDEMQVHLAAAPYAPVTLRSLGVPGRALRLERADSANEVYAWSKYPGGEPAPPLAVNMRAGSEHWLLSDGASEIFSWAQNAPLSKLLTAGSALENVGVSGLVVSINGAATQLLVSVRNGGLQDAQRSLGVYAGETLLMTVPLSLAPAQEVQRVLKLPLDLLAGATPLRVSLNPGDALALDDELQIAAAELELPRVRVSEQCGRHLRAALVANPVLAVRGYEKDRYEEGRADLVVACAPDALLQTGPAILVRAAGSVAMLGGELYWHAVSGPLSELTLAPGALRGASLDEPGGTGLGLLSVGDDIVIYHDLKQGLIDVRLDLAAPELVQSPEYPLLVSGLVDLALGRETGTGVLAAQRNPAPAAIAPRALALGPTPPAGAAQGSGRELFVYLISMALGLLFLDGVLLLFRIRGQSQTLKAWQFRHAP